MYSKSLYNPSAPDILSPEHREDLEERIAIMMYDAGMAEERATFHASQLLYGRYKVPPLATWGE